MKTTFKLWLKGWEGVRVGRKKEGGVPWLEEMTGAKSGPFLKRWQWCSNLNEMAWCGLSTPACSHFALRRWVQKTWWAQHASRKAWYLWPFPTVDQPEHSQTLLSVMTVISSTHKKNQNFCLLFSDCFLCRKLCQLIWIFVVSLYSLSHYITTW